MKVVIILQTLVQTSPTILLMRVDFIRFRYVYREPAFQFRHRTVRAVSSSVPICSGRFYVNATWAADTLHGLLGFVKNMELIEGTHCH